MQQPRLTRFAHAGQDLLDGVKALNEIGSIDAFYTNIRIGFR